MSTLDWDARKLDDGSYSVWVDGSRVDFAADGSAPVTQPDTSLPYGTPVAATVEPAVGGSFLLVRIDGDDRIALVSPDGTTALDGAPQDSGLGSVIEEVLPNFPVPSSPDFVIRRERQD